MNSLQSHILQRHIVALEPQAPTITIRTMNTLASICADQSEFGFPHVDLAILDWEHRKHLLIQELIAHQATFLCLQEVEEQHWNEWFQPELLKHGYDGVWYGNGKHGCALLWQASTWTRTSCTYYDIPGNKVFIYGKFVHNVTSMKINVGVTHLKAKKPFASDRLCQGNYILNIICMDTDPTFIAGDFNASPDEPVIKLFAQEMESAYGDVEQNSDHYTTVKVRAEMVRHCIDYIWYRHFTLVQRLEIPSPESIPYPGLPMINYPSDHLSIMAGFI